MKGYDFTRIERDMQERTRFWLERPEFTSPLGDIGVLNLEFQVTVLIPPLG